MNFNKLFGIDFAKSGVFFLMLKLNTCGVFHLSCAKLHFFHLSCSKLSLLFRKACLYRGYFLHSKEALCTVNVKVYKLNRALITVSTVGEITDNFTFLLEIRPSSCGMSSQGKS